MNNQVKIAWFGKHFGEEPPLTGDCNQGAGGIFFSGCNLRCCFCQNYQISQENIGGKFYNTEELADIMIDLQSNDCICVDLVSPTIWYKQIKESILIAKNKGLIIPIVWNSNGYEDVKIIKEMEGLIDVYLPDFKYYYNDLALKYSGIENYKETAILAIKEMYNQVGIFKEQKLKTKNAEKLKKENQKEEIAKNRGLIIRHLILPNNVDNSFGVLNEISNIDKNIHISLMSQYNPVYNAKKFIEIDRKLTMDEFDLVYNYQLLLGMENGWYQEMNSSDCFVPDFKKDNPF